jgi:hypothetical protein
MEFQRWILSLPAACLPSLLFSTLIIPVVLFLMGKLFSELNWSVEHHFPYLWFAQGSAGQHKSHGSGYSNTSNKHSSSRHQKSGSKRNPNGAHPFSVPFPYQQPAMSPVFPAMAPPPHIAVSGYPYQPGPPPFPTVETHLIKSGSETGPPMQPFAPSINVQPPPRGDPNAYAVNFPNRRPNMQDSGGHLNPTWHHQRAFGSRDNIPLQQVMGPRPLVRPPFFAAPPGYMVGPTFPGNYFILMPSAFTQYISASCSFFFFRTMTFTYIYVIHAFLLLIDDVTCFLYSSFFFQWFLNSFSVKLSAVQYDLYMSYRTTTYMLRICCTSRLSQGTSTFLFCSISN